MPPPEPDQRTPPPSYAALRAVVDEQSAKAGGRSTAPAIAEASYLDDETRKLESLKGALFDAFEAAPETGIPTVLVDLVSTYTNTLRLQLTLMGYTATPRRSSRSPAPAVAQRKTP